MQQVRKPAIQQTRRFVLPLKFEPGDGLPLRWDGLDLDFLICADARAALNE